ncbi:class I SAM-dependent methyltransferase [Janthinobacterium agaricidamnosum]|uniref:Methyltransferase domain protein n=1 Tax=Janthinobacterium agaricidamnosum NBRC 102515 = DSM 9628 TaxID=1349767 RepID=W0V6J6_9BURK|nr:class I SAM-dependent methyltransferase [Janthinobacterium agaricidamnosum]CDG82902.1 methyltransferase domain protein [Janthinobacterium agaricidamnosum NBRC 102515 = DSM 9628]
MDSAASEKSIIALDSWLQTPAGLYVRAWEQACLDSLTADIFGFNALQIGMPHIDALAANRMPNKWVADTRLPPLVAGPGARRASVILNFDELPFASQSLDLVVLPHVLEFAAEPHQVLREVERVLIPEGQLIICGFNPTSLWGARQAMGRVTGSRFLPQAGEFISMPRMKDWLKLLNLGVSQSHVGGYAPACKTDKWLHRYAFMDRAGPRWWPYFGAVYIVHAIKRVKGMRLIGPAWTKKPASASAGVPVTNKSKSNSHKRREQQDG